MCSRSGFGTMTSKAEGTCRELKRNANYRERERENIDIFSTITIIICNFLDFGILYNFIHSALWRN